MKFTTILKRTALVAVIATGLNSSASAVEQFWNTNGTQASWTAANWGTSGAGPFTTAWTTGNSAHFTANSLLTGATTNVTGVIVDAGINARIATITGTIGTGGTVATINVGTGGVFDMSTQAISAAAGTGFIKTGDGIWKSGAGAAYTGGFTLNAGTVILAGINGMGGGAVNVNGGTIAANASRAIVGVTALNVGGNFTLGAVTTGVASGDATAAAAISLTAPINLGAATRTITLGANTTASHTFSGAITNGGLTVDGATGATGRIILTNTGSTYAGGTTINVGGTISTTGTSSTGVGPVTAGPLGVGNLTINGGRFIPSSSGTNTIGNNITLTSGGTNSIAVGGISTLAGNISGPGGFRKGSGGAIILTGTNNYSGVTLVEDGTVGFANRNAFYNGVTSQWNDTNLVVGAVGANTATATFAVGVGPNDFTLTEWLNLSTLGTATGGFLDLGSIGIDTTNNGGDVTLSAPLTNTNSGANRLGLAKSGTNNLILTAANTHGGVTTTIGGAINLSNALALQNSTLAHTTTGSIVFDQSAGTAFTLGGLSGAGTLGLFNNANAAIALTVGNNNTDTSFTGAFSSVVSGSSLIKVGTGAQTLSGINVYDGGTFLNGGKLIVNHKSALGLGALNIAAGTALDNTTGANIVIDTIPVNVNGNFTFAGTRALDLGAGPITFAGNTTITVTGAGGTNNALSISSVISGPTLALSIAGVGRTFFKAQNTYGGGTSILGGTLHVNEQSSNFGGGTGPLGTSTVTFATGQLIMASVPATVNTLENHIALTGTAATCFITSNGTSTLSGLIDGSGGVTTSGTGNVILSNAANTYSGSTIVQGGSTGGTLTVSGSHVGGGDYVVASNSVTPTVSSNLSVTGTINASGNLDIDRGNVTVGTTGSLTVNDTINSAGAGTLSVNAGGTMVSNNLRADTVTLDGTATVRTNGGAGGASKIETLTIGAAAKLNLKDNDLVVGTAANVDAVRAAIKTGVAGSLGITSDTVAFGVTTGFGYALGNNPAISPLLAGSLSGQTYDADSVLVKYTFLGDADLDGDSDLNDLGLWAQSFTGDLGNPAIPVTFWTSGDFDYDGDTDLNDLGFWAGTFTGDLGGGAGSLIVVAPNAPAGAVAALSSMGITVVPEPSTFVLAGVGLTGLAIAARRRKK